MVQEFVVSERHRRRSHCHVPPLGSMYVHDVILLSKLFLRDVQQPCHLPVTPHIDVRRSEVELPCRAARLRLDDHFQLFLNNDRLSFDFYVPCCLRCGDTHGGGGGAAPAAADCFYQWDGRSHRVCRCCRVFVLMPRACQNCRARRQRSSTRTLACRTGW